MRLSTSLALVSCLVSLSACAVEADEDTGVTSDAIAVAAGFVYADAEQFRLPAPESAANPAIASVNVNTKLVVYCKTGNYLGSNVRSGFAVSYIPLDPDGDGAANVKRCLTKEGATAACAAPAPAPAVALAPLTIPASSLSLKRASLAGDDPDPGRMVRTFRLTGPSNPQEGYIENADIECELSTAYANENETIGVASPITCKGL